MMSLFTCHIKQAFINFSSEIDECAVGLHTCDNNAICINTRGSYECTCQVGYYGDGFSCTRKYRLEKLNTRIILTAAFNLDTHDSTHAMKCNVAATI